MYLIENIYASNFPFFVLLYVLLLDTTRKPRPGEENGVHYWFVDQDQMEQMIARGEFFEHARFGGNFYGTRFFISTAFFLSFVL